MGTQAMINADSSIAPLDGYAKHTLPEPPTRSQKGTFGPVEASKQQPTIARLRDVLTALQVHGTCRHVAYELLTYWKPGGIVFPSVKRLAAGIGVDPRSVRRHVARLERIGLWVRVGRQGRSNHYDLRLPGGKEKSKCPLLTPDTRIRPPGHQDPPEVTTKVTKQSTKRRARKTCEDCGRSWLAKYGTTCYACSDKPRPRSKTPNTKASYYGRVRNCPQCHTFEREHDDTCAHCSWTRAAWDARSTDGKA